MTVVIIVIVPPLDNQKIIHTMESPIICPDGYAFTNGQCIHTLWPFTLDYFIGTILLALVTVLSSMAGLGGGGVALPILITFFDYLPKDSTIVVFCAIMGTSFGNISNLLQDSINGKPLVKYQYVFVSIPIMFTGAIVGVFMNKLLPSISICLLLFTICVTTVKKTYLRFRDEYSKQNEHNLMQNLDQNIEIHERINPLKNEQHYYVLKNLAILTLIMIILSFCRGSERMPSIIGIQPCSVLYWGLIIFSFILIGAYAYRNFLIATKLMSQPQALTDQSSGHTGQFDKNIREVTSKSILAGVLSGFGLGGGIVLVPMYRNLGCKSLEATASCALGIFITSFVNCIQGISIGVIQFSQFFYFVAVLSTSAYFFSKIISAELKRRNRMSYVTGLFLVLIIIGTVNIPIAVYKKYQQNGYDLNILFGFGTLC